MTLRGEPSWGGLAAPAAAPSVNGSRPSGSVPIRSADNGAASDSTPVEDLESEVYAARDLHAATGLVLERGRLGVWLVGEAGALLVRGRRVHCFCVRVPDPDLPSSDRIAHLLLALREDEIGFATVANHAFAGARWRVRRRLPVSVRPALDAAR